MIDLHSVERARHAKFLALTQIRKSVDQSDELIGDDLRLLAQNSFEAGFQKGLVVLGRVQYTLRLVRSDYRSQFRQDFDVMANLVYRTEAAKSLERTEGDR